MSKSKNRVIMAWSKCKIEIAPMPDDETMASDDAMMDIGILRNNSTSMTTEDGDSLQAQESGGGIVAEEVQEGSFKLQTELIEPSNDLYVALGLGSVKGDDLMVKTHIVNANYSVKLTPKNLGAKGVKAPKCSISVAPSFGDDTGNGLAVTINILNGDAGYWYSKFVHRGDLKLDKYNISLANSDTSSMPDQTVTVTTDESTVVATANADWCVVQVSDKTVKIGAKANSGAERTATVTITAGAQRSIVTVMQAGAE